MTKTVYVLAALLGVVALGNLTPSNSAQASEISQNALLVGSGATAWDGRSADTYPRAKVTAYSLEDYSELLSFEAYSKKVGAQVASGDVDGDGVMDIVTIPFKQRLAPAVKVFDLSGNLKATAIVPRYHGDRLKQYRLAVGDVDNDGQAEIVLSNASGNQLTLDVFTVNADTLTRLDHYEMAQPDNYQRGSWVSIGNVDTDDDAAEIVTAPMVGSAILDVFSLNEGEVTQINHDLTYTVDHATNPNRGLHISAGDGAVLAAEHGNGDLHLLVWGDGTLDEGPLEAITGDYSVGTIGDLAWLTGGTFAYSSFVDKTVHYHSYSASGATATAEEDINVNSRGAFVNFLTIE